MNKKKIAKKMLKFSKKEIVAEHKKLVRDLRSKNPSKLKAEANKQAKELKHYIKQ